MRSSLQRLHDSVHRCAISCAYLDNSFSKKATRLRCSFHVREWPNNEDRAPDLRSMSSIIRRSCAKSFCTVVYSSSKAPFAKERNRSNTGNKQTINRSKRTFRKEGVRAIVRCRQNRAGRFGKCPRFGSEEVLQFGFKSRVRFRRGRSTVAKNPRRRSCW